MTKKSFPFLQYYQENWAVSDSTVNDSTKKTVKDTIQQDTTDLKQQDSIEGILQTPSSPINSAKLDSIFKKNEEREKQIKAKEKIRQEKPVIEKKPTKVDTTATLYKLFKVTELPISERINNIPDSNNFLFHIPETRTHFKNKQKQTVFNKKQTEATGTLKTSSEIREIPRQKEKSVVHSDWITFILIFLFLLIGWSRLFFKKYFHNLIRSFHFYKYAQILYNESNSITIRSAISLNINFFIVGGLFVFQALHYFNPQLIHFEGIKEMFFYSVILLIWYAWNYLMTRFTGITFQKREAFNEYFQNYNLYRKIFGLVIFPIVVAIQFTPEEIKLVLIYTGFLLFGIVYLMHILRGLQIFMKKNISLFYLILYLCALEFLPILVWLKLIKEGF
jgi:hypothetical protein